MRKQHRWSGWPGAICLDCGQEDQLELCVAGHDESLKCVEGHMLCIEHPPNRCAMHVNRECPGRTCAWIKTIDGHVLVQSGDVITVRDDAGKLVITIRRGDTRTEHVLASRFEVE